MFLAAKYASAVGETKVTIFTVDSDVAILGCYFVNNMPILVYLQIGVGNNRRVMDITSSKISEKSSKRITWSSCYLWL